MSSITCLRLLVFCFIFTACGEVTRSRSSKEIVIPLTREEFHSIKNFQSFSCESQNSEQCPAGLGRVLVLNHENKLKTKICSAFLVAANRLLTNNHCIANADECQRTVVSLYNGHTTSIHGCKRILATKADSVNYRRRSVDFTLLELDSFVDSNVFSVAQQSALPGEVLTVWAVDQMNSNQARITQLTCSFLAENYSMELNSCPTISGNSGSPVLNSSHQVVGILWGGTQNNSLDEKTPLEQRREADELSLVTDVESFRAYLTRQ